jgi:fructose-1,6-bisphosphatase
MRGYSLACIFDANPIAAIAIASDWDCAAIAVELDRILDQVGEHLHQSMWIGEDFAIERDKVT